jgi:hypothetical protein
MLDSETKLIQSTPDHPKIIAWSDSGTAFRIFDAVEFAASVLPKYFRTRKFSSFQRNLNLVSDGSRKRLSVTSKSTPHQIFAGTVVFLCGQIY